MKRLLVAGLILWSCGEEATGTAQSENSAEEWSSESAAEDDVPAGELPLTDPDRTAATTQGAAAGVPVSTSHPLLQANGCMWWEAFPGHCSSEPCPILSTYSLRCEGTINHVSLAAEGDAIRIAFSHQGTFHMHQIADKTFDAVSSFTPESEPELGELGQFRARLSSFKDLMVWNAAGVTGLKRLEDGSLNDVELGLPDYALFQTAGLSSDGELVIVVVTGEELAIKPLERLSNFDGGHSLELAAGMVMTHVTPGSKVRGLSQLDKSSQWWEFSESDVQAVDGLPGGVFALSAAPSGLLALATDFQILSATSPTPSNLFRELTVWSGGASQVIDALDSPHTVECSGITTDEICPTETTSSLIGHGLNAPSAATNEDGDFISTIMESATELCRWLPVTCDSSGFCSHDRGCERSAERRRNSRLHIYDTDGPLGEALQIESTTRFAHTESAGSGHLLHVATVSEDEVVLHTLETSAL